MTDSRLVPFGLPQYPGVNGRVGAGGRAQGKGRFFPNYNGELHLLSQQVKLLLSEKKNPFFFSPFCFVVAKPNPDCVPFVTNVTAV